MIHIAIPLKAKKYSKNWSMVIKNLSRTIESITNSTDSRYEIIIATNDPVDLQATIKPQKSITIIRAPFGRPEHPYNPGNRDKDKKRCLIASTLKKRQKNAYSIMFLDADDLIHKDLIKYVLEKNQRSSYAFQFGYMLYITTGLLTSTTKFPERSGSCFIGYYENTELPDNADEQGNLISKYTESRSAKHRKMSKYDIEVVPFKAAVHLRGSSESISSQKKAKQAAYERNQSLYNRISVVVKKMSKLLMRQLTEKKIKTHKSKQILLKDFGVSEYFGER
jgi:hypothetical protein